jgi:hypothetical protein
MKRKALLCILCFVFGCGTLQVKTATSFGADEMDLVQKAVLPMGIDCSYDYDMNIWCFFNMTGSGFSSTDEKSVEDEKKLADSIAKEDDLLVRSTYGKLYSNYYSMLYMKGYYEKKKQWKYFNLLNKMIVPSTEYFLCISERVLSKKKPDIRSYLEGRKAAMYRDSVAATIERVSVVDGFN